MAGMNPPRAPLKPVRNVGEVWMNLPVDAPRTSYAVGDTSQKGRELRASRPVDDPHSHW